MTTFDEVEKTKITLRLLDVCSSKSQSEKINVFFGPLTDMRDHDIDIRDHDIDTRDKKFPTCFCHYWSNHQKITVHLYTKMCGLEKHEKTTTHGNRCPGVVVSRFDKWGHEHPRVTGHK